MFFTITPKLVREFKRYSLPGDALKNARLHFLDKAIEEYRRNQLLDAANAAYAALRSDEAAWQDELTERLDWEATLADGLDDE